METGKLGLVSASAHINSVAAQTEKRMDVQAPLTAVYIHTVPALPAQPYSHPPAAAREPAALHLAMPPLYSKEMLPFLTLHIAGGLQSQPGLSLAAAASHAARPKSAGKHVCPHCGRDCMKPSVLEKHLRCHTGERPYPCTTCGISFKTQSNLYKHKRTQAHARLSSESEQSSMSSLDSVSSCKESQMSSLSLDEHSEVPGCVEKESTPPNAEMTCATRTAKVFTTKMHSSAHEQNEFTNVNQDTKETSDKMKTEGEKQRTEKEKSHLSRHLPLQRQEATLFSKQWESSVTREKSQNHESTDSGFSESSDHYPSPGGILPEHSMDSLTETTKEHLEEHTSAETQTERDHVGQEAKECARVQEQKSLEERISKLISENTAVVEDRQLENVRPRKTVLSKQGSIDLPMPYTYKDSFHFDMRISKTPNVGLQRNRKPGLYNSVPSQHSMTTEHAPLTRSNSLPFSVTLLQPENSSPTTSSSSSSSSSYHSDYVTLVRRGSSGQINPSGFAIKPVNQQSSTHRPLVRQTAVDCNHATDGLFTNLSVEEAAGGSLSFDSDICGEPSNKKFRRKKAQKFAYNKWYMYGGGTFKKLYSAEKGGDEGAVKGRKCSTNPEPEVAQGLQKRLSDIHKETVVTTCSTKNLTNSSATVSHFDTPPAKLSLVPAVDFNLKTNQLHTSCSSVKTPLQRNLSLSVLPFPLIGSLIGHREDSMNGPKDGKLINEDKHNESSLELCGALVPSDRKKQKTDNKTSCPLEMETEANTQTQPPLSVTGSAQDPNLAYINIKKNQQLSQLTGTLVPPCIINANPSSVSASPAASTHAIAKTSYLPKYQLKLPSAAEPVANASFQAVDKLSGADSGSFPSALSSSITTATNKCSDVTSSPLNQNQNLLQSCDTKKTNVFASTQSQHLLPCIATTLSEPDNKSATSSLPVVHRQLAGTTITTTCLQDNRVRLCSTPVQLSKHMGSSTPIQQPRPVASFPDASAVTTANRYQASAATITSFSPREPNLNLPLSHTQLSRASVQLTPANRAYANPSTSVMPCHIVPFNQVQPAVQNVFHVHTADLQICLQIISDEQLALIEPQIERQAGNNVSQKAGTDAGALDVVQKTAQASVTMDGSREGMDHQQPGHHEGTDQSESSLTLNEQRKKPEGNASTPATETAEYTPPEAAVSSLHPHKSGHVSTVTDTQSIMAEVMSTAASLKGVKSDRSLASEDHPPFVNRFAEDQVLPGVRVSQGGSVSEMLPGQHKLSRNSLSPCTVNQNSTQGNAQGSEGQHKLKNQGTAFNVGTTKVSMCKGSKSESHLPSQSQVSGAACSHKLSASVSQFPIKKCKALRELNPQASIYCSGPVVSTPSEVLNPSKHVNTGCDTVSPVDDSVCSQETAQSESQDVISTGHSENQTSTGVQMERPKDIPAVPSRVQSPTAENTGGDFLAGCAAQTETRTQGHAGTCGQLSRSDWRPRHSQEARGTNHKCMEEQGEEVERGYKDGGVTPAEEQWGSADSDSGQYACFQDGTQLEGEDRKTKADLSKHSRWSEHLHHPSKTQSRMTEYPEQSPQHAPGTSNNPNFPVSSSQTSLFNSPQTPFEMTNFYFSQQHWDSNVIHKQQTQFSCESSSGQHIKETQIEPCPQHTQIFSLQDQNITTVTGCTNLTLGSQKSVFPDVITLSSTGPSPVPHSVQSSGVTTGLTGHFHVSNSSVLDNNKVPSNPLTHPQSDKYQDSTSFFFASQLQGYQPPECMPSGVRPVQSCQDYTEDTSSSDDEGKLIIEL